MRESVFRRGIGDPHINILTWLRGFQVKIANFLSLFCLSIPKRDFDTKQRTPNIDICPESLRAYWTGLACNGGSCGEISLRRHSNANCI